MKKEDIDRINELARKAKTVGLTPEENEERAVLRRAYIDSVVGDLRQQLDNTYIVDSKGNKRKLRQYSAQQEIQGRALRQKQQRNRDRKQRLSRLVAADIHACQHAGAAEAGRERQQQRLRDPAAVTARKIFIQQHNCKAGRIH